MLAEARKERVAEARSEKLGKAGSATHLAPPAA